MRIKDIVRVTRGNLLSGDPERRIDPDDISTDSRTAKTGDIFLALKGERFDGNFFIGEVLKKGVAGIIASDFTWKIDDPSRIVVNVADTTKALQDIARYHREQFNIPVICVTGSNGKTTVKDMIWEVLSAGYSVLKNEGTKNNHIGVPQTLLKLKKSHEICVLELGANHRGEIKSLAAIAKPTAAVITGIGPSHLEFFGDLDGVFAAKKEILSYLAAGSPVFLNGDDRYLKKIRPGSKRIIKYGFDRTNGIVCEWARTHKGRISFKAAEEVFTMGILGPHNVYNAMAAIAVGIEFGIGGKLIKKAIAGYRPVKMRLNLKRLSGVVIINDAYNSNPQSMKGAIETIKSYPAKAKWIVSGDMLELGRRSSDMHRMIGKEIAGANIDGLLTFGKLSKYTLSEARLSGMPAKNLWHCSTHGQIASILRKVVKPGDAVLLKGSRGMKLEEVIDILKIKLQDPGNK